MIETRPYHNEATQSERKAIVKNDTLFARQQNTIDDAGGRYAKLTPSNVTGSTPSPQYPQIPSGPWSGDDPVPNEEPLGFSVDAMEPLEPTPEPPEVNPSPPTVEVGVGEPADVSNLAASSAGSPIRRREW